MGSIQRADIAHMSFGVRVTATELPASAAIARSALGTNGHARSGRHVAVANGLPTASIRLPDDWHKTATSPLEWGAIELLEPVGRPLVPSLRRTLLQLHRLGSVGGSSRSWESRISRLVQQPPAREFAGAVEILAWCYATSQLRRVVSHASWHELVDYLAAFPDKSRGVAEDGLIAASSNGAAGSVGDYLVRCLLDGERWLALAACGVEQYVAPPSLDSAVGTLVDRGNQLLVGEGLPKPGCRPYWRALLACWTRAIWVCGSAAAQHWDERSLSTYVWMLRQAIRLARPDGSPMFGHSRGRTDDELFRVAVELAAPTAADSKTWLARYRSGKVPTRAKAAPSAPASVVHSEAAKLAVLRPSWGHRDPRLGVAYDHGHVTLDLSNHTRQLIEGEWQVEIAANGKSLAPVRDWEPACWISDVDIDYLELCREFEGGVRIERQVLLARKDAFALLADCVIANRACELSYVGRLPLSAKVVASSAAETREMLLASGRRLARVLPLALPEWRCDHRVGTFEVHGHELQLRQRADRALGLYAPLFIELAVARMSREITWRQLTVAEAMKPVTSDIASGYRVQVGRKHWLAYRSIARHGNRTLLGHNLSTEFLVASLDANGLPHTLLEIE